MKGRLPRTVGVVVIVLALAVVCTTTSVSAADFGVNPPKFCLDFPNSENMGAILQFTVTNADETAEVFTVEHWNYRTLAQDEVDGGLEYADPTWIVDISPSSILVPKSSSAVFNVAFSVPRGTSDGNYETWLKIDKGDGSPFPFTLSFRIGSAVPMHEYGIKPSYFRLLVEGGGSGSRPLYVTIVNTGSADATYIVYPRIPDDPEVIDPEYVWRGERDLEWIVIGNSEVEILAGEEAEVTYDFEIPSSVPTGQYKVWVGIKDVSQEGIVQIEYAQKLLIDVVRESSSASVSEEKGLPLWVVVVSSVGGSSVLVILLGFGVRRGRRRRKILGKRR